MKQKNAEQLQPGEKFLYDGRCVALEGTWMSPHTLIMRLTCRDVVTGEAIEIKSSKGFPFTQH